MVLLAACSIASPTATPKPGGPMSAGVALATSIPGVRPNLDKVVRDAPGEGYRVDTRRLSGAYVVGAGQLFRVLGKNESLLFVVYNDGAYAPYAKVNGSLQSLVDPETSSVIKPNAANRLRVFARGEVLNLVVNGTLPDTITVEGAWTGGQIRHRRGGQ
jgi:hypothetical protein